MSQNLVNIYLAPEKIANPNGMQITYEKDGIRRNLYVFGNDGKTTSGERIKQYEVFGQISELRFFSLSKSKIFRSGYIDVALKSGHKHHCTDETR